MVQIKNMVCKLDQYPRYGDEICMSWLFVYNIKMSNSIRMTSSFNLGDQIIYAVR